jgi:hypothetical protein
LSFAATAGSFLSLDCAFDVPGFDGCALSSCFALSAVALFGSAPLLGFVLVGSFEADIPSGFVAAAPLFAVAADGFVVALGSGFA